MYYNRERGDFEDLAALILCSHGCPQPCDGAPRRPSPIHSMKSNFSGLLGTFFALAFSSFTPLFATTLASVPPAAAFDLQGFINTRVAAGDTTIVIPPGRHLVTPRDKQHLLLRGLRNLVIEATGAELVCSETIRAITIEECENLTLRGLVIDYDPLPFTQARITAISEDRTRLELELIPGYAAPGPSSHKLETFDPATKELRGRITHYGIVLKHQDDGRVTVVRQPGASAASTDHVGDIAVLDREHAPSGVMPHAVFATNSRGLVFENIALYSGPTFGFLEVNCDGSRYLDCAVDRRPPHLDYATRGQPRMRSINADAFHSKNARVGPRYERCVARYNGDDSIAINGDFHFVSAAEGNTLRVLAKTDMNMRVGDTVQLFTHDGSRLADQKITALTPAGPATAEEREFAGTRGIQTRLLNRALMEAWTITFDGPVGDTPSGTLIASADAIGSGFEIRDCILGHNRSRGILVKAGRGQIVGNTLSGSVAASILVAPEYYWLEAGFADDLVVADNTLRDIRGPGIVVTVSAPNNSVVAPVGAFRNIIIRDNTVSGGPAPGLLVTSVDGLTNQNNRVSVDPTQALNSWEIRAWGRSGLELVMIQNSR